MAVYTKITNKDILLLSKKFNLGKIIKFKGIKKGIENTNYLLKTNNKKFILTIFEKRVQKKDLPYFMKLMDILNQQKISCPKPIKDKDGRYLTLIKNKTACIVTFLNGKDKQNLNNKNCFDVGKNIGKLHKISHKIKLYRKNSMSINNLESLLKSINFKSKAITPNLKSILIKNLKQFIDFYFSCNDYSMYEVAICINSLCFDKKNNKFLLNNQKVRSLINGYQRIKKISQNEKDALNVLCRGAALRYLLTRIYDYINTPKTALIKIKDPKEYFQKLIIHNSLNSYKNYYN